MEPLLSPDGMTVEQAITVLTRALSELGGARMVLPPLGEVRTTIFTAEKEGKRFRRGEPMSLVVGDWGFVAVEPNGTRVQIQHIVRGIPVQSTLVGPAETAERLARAILAAAESAGPEAVVQAQSALYGIAAVHGLA